MRRTCCPSACPARWKDSGTVTSPLIPWNLCGAFISAALGVGCFEYLPYALFCWLCPLIAVIWGFLGKFQWKTGEIPSKKTYRPRRRDGRGGQEVRSGLTFK